MSNLRQSDFDGSLEKGRASSLASKDAAMCGVPQHIIDMMRKIRSQNNRVPIMQQFGISDNSWRKLQAGQPLRQSVTERLIARVVNMDYPSSTGIDCNPDCDLRSE